MGSICATADGFVSQSAAHRVAGLQNAVHCFRKVSSSYNIRAFRTTTVEPNTETEPTTETVEALFVRSTYDTFKAEASESHSVAVPLVYGAVQPRMYTAAEMHTLGPRVSLLSRMLQSHAAGSAITI